MSTQTVPTADARPSYLALAAGAGAVAALFWPTFVALAAAWESDPNYSHGWLVLPIALGLALHAAQKGDAPAAGQPLLGGVFLGLGVLIHLTALVLSWPLIDFLGVVVVLRAWAVCAGGQGWAARFTFPILFLFFMFPLPAPWTSQLAVWLQEWVAVSANAVLNLFVVCRRQGTSLHLAGVREPLVVAEACSGLRQIVAFVALAALVGHFVGRGRGFRLTLLVAAVPIAILANVFRVLLMAFGAYHFGTDWLHGRLHDAPNLVTIPFGLALFFLLTWGLGKCWPARTALEVAA